MSPPTVFVAMFAFAVACASPLPPKVGDMPMVAAEAVQTKNLVVYSDDWTCVLKASMEETNDGWRYTRKLHWECMRMAP